jgi:hypothetical protein
MSTFYIAVLLSSISLASFKITPSAPERTGLFHRPVLFALSNSKTQIAGMRIAFLKSVVIEDLMGDYWPVHAT